MTLKEARANVGAGVVYRVGPSAEDGVITSVGEFYVYVRYKGDNHSKATAPEQLEFLSSKLTKEQA